MSIRLLLPVALVLSACAQTETAAPETLPVYTMEQQMERNVPGAEHERLQPLVGRFAGAGRFWVEEGAEPMTMDGVMVNSWMLDGHFLRQDWDAEWMGMPFKGFGLFGYDTLLGKYQGFWIDNASMTMHSVMEGQALDERTIETRGTMYDANVGQIIERRDVLTIHGRTKHSFEMFVTYPGQEEQLNMRIDYTRLPDEEPGLTDEMRAQLQALGYLGSDG